MRLEAGQEVLLETTPIHWAVLRVSNLRIRGNRDLVRVRSLRRDGGQGEDLLLPGWHHPDEFGTGASAVFRDCTLRSNTMSVLVRAESSAAVVVSLVVDVLQDDSYGPVALGSGSATRPSGRRVRLPLERVSPPPGDDGFSPISRWETPRLPLSTVRILAPVLCGAPLGTAIRDLRIGSNPCLLPVQDWCSALDYDEPEPVIRASPVLVWPNTVSAEIFSEDPLPDSFRPYLVCSVL